MFRCLVHRIFLHKQVIHNLITMYKGHKYTAHTLSWLFLMLLAKKIIPFQGAADDTCRSNTVARIWFRFDVH
jgi:hypothetical protein